MGISGELLRDVECFWVPGFFFFFLQRNRVLVIGEEDNTKGTKVEF